MGEPEASTVRKMRETPADLGNKSRLKFLYINAVTDFYPSSLFPGNGRPLEPFNPGDTNLGGGDSNIFHVHPHLGK